MANTAKLAGKNNIEIWFDFNWDTLNLIKTLPGRRFQSDARGKYWTAPISIDAVGKLQKAGFKLDPALKALANTPKITVDKVKEINVTGLKRELFPFQQKGVAFIEAKDGRALVGDEMGLGKTIQALAWLHLHPEKRPVIVLCPAHLKLNWVQEIGHTLPGSLSVQMLSGQKPYPLIADIIILNYDILPSWLETLQAISPKVMIFDEAHYIKNSSAARTKATKKLAKGIPHVIALTGTPIVNRPIEGFNIAQVVNRAVFPDFWHYTKEFCGAKHTGYGWDFSGATNKEKLHRILTETIMIRRKKADVLPDLPDKIYSYIPVELDNMREYQKAEQEFIQYLRETKGEAAARKASGAEHLVQVETLKQLAIKGKMGQAIEWIRDFLTSGNGDSKLIVFTVHRAAVDRLMAEFKDVAVKVDGSVSADKRNEAVQAFQTNPEVKLFVGNIQAAGTGLTLTAASSVAFLELPWTPGELVQAEDRCHRIGQKNSVNVYYLLADSTIERKIAELLDEKRKVLEAVLDGREVEETRLLTELIDSYREAN